MRNPVMLKSVTLTEYVSVFVSVFLKFVTSKALRVVVVTPRKIIGGIYRVTTEQLRTGGYPLSSLLNKGIADAT